MKTPIYLMFACFICVMLVLANLNGWSMVRTFSQGSFLPAGPSTRHK